MTVARQQRETNAPLFEHPLGFHRSDLIEPAPITVEELELQLDLGVAGNDDREAFALAVGYDVPATSSWGSILKIPASRVTVRSPGSLRPDSTCETATRDTASRSANSCWVSPSLARWAAIRRPRFSSTCQLT